MAVEDAKDVLTALVGGGWTQEQHRILLAYGTKEWSEGYLTGEKDFKHE